MREGRFRTDLFYRINVLPVSVPGLAERLDELPDWAHYMLRRCYRDSGGTGSVALAEEAIRRLLAYAWPGNLRQLDNIIRRSHVFARGTSERAPDELIVQATHVERALDIEDAGDQGELMSQLVSCARLFVREAEIREELSLDESDLLRALIIIIAVERTGGKRDDAFRFLGKENLLKARNHHREYKKALARIRTVEKALGTSTSILDGLGHKPD